MCGGLFTGREQEAPSVPGLLETETAGVLFYPAANAASRPARTGQAWFVSLCWAAQGASDEEEEKEEEVEGQEQVGGAVCNSTGVMP